MSNRYYNAKDLDPNKMVNVKLPTYYKFKNNKHSVIMILDEIKGDTYYLHNRDYPFIKYEAKAEDLEKVKDESI